MLSANQHGKTFNNIIIFLENLSLLNVDIQIHVYIKVYKVAVMYNSRSPPVRMVMLGPPTTFSATHPPPHNLSIHSHTHRLTVH